MEVSSAERVVLKSFIYKDLRFRWTYVSTLVRIFYETSMNVLGRLESGKPSQAEGLLKLEITIILLGNLPQYA